MENTAQNVNKLYQIVTFTTVDNLSQVKNALFKAGAGRIGDYDSCCFESKGMGQFRPLKGSNPAIGSIDNIERVEEVRLELVCEGKYLVKAIDALRTAHNYEEPAIYITQLETRSLKR